jgi:hypothetical protein
VDPALTLTPSATVIFRLCRQPYRPVRQIQKRSSSDLWHRTNELSNNLPDALPSHFLPCAMAPTMLTFGASIFCRGAAAKAAVPSPCSTSGFSGPFPGQVLGVRTYRSPVQKQRSFQKISMSGNGVTVAASQRTGPILGHYPL